MKTIWLKGGGMSHCSAERGGGCPNCSVIHMDTILMCIMRIIVMLYSLLVDRCVSKII